MPGQDGRGGAAAEGGRGSHAPGGLDEAAQVRGQTQVRGRAAEMRIRSPPAATSDVIGP